MAIILSPNRVVLKYDFKKYVDLDVVKTTLEAGQAEMKTWHYDQTKGYVKVLDATYVKIQKLEDQIVEEELNDEKKQEETKITNKLEDDERTPMGKLLTKGKEIIEEPVT